MPHPAVMKVVAGKLKAHTADRLLIPDHLMLISNYILIISRSCAVNANNTDMLIINQRKAELVMFVQDPAVFSVDMQCID